MPKPIRRKTGNAKITAAKYRGEKPSRGEIATNLRAMAAGLRGQIAELKDQLAKDSTSKLAQTRKARIEELTGRAGKLIKAAEDFES
jgi:arsenate reductase-like glutaredoxin family protein